MAGAGGAGAVGAVALSRLEPALATVGAVLPGRLMPGPRIVALPEPRPLARAVCSGVLDRVVRARAWVLLIGALLVGVVFLNVGLLRASNDVARMSERAAVLKRDNAGLRATVARLGSSERIQAQAARQGFVHPDPGDVRFLRLDPRRDAALAVRRMRAARAQGVGTAGAPGAAVVGGTAPGAAGAAPVVGSTVPGAAAPPGVEPRVGGAPVPSSPEAPGAAPGSAGATPPELLTATPPTGAAEAPAQP